MTTPLDESALSTLSRPASTALVVTLGSRGALSVDPAGVVVASPSHDVEVVDSTGAGDAFVGALAATLAGGSTLHETVRWGSAAGAIATTVPGARHPGVSRNAVERLVAGAQ